ncbi:ribonuclease III, partial [Patescibacteria group bacterium]|nr:ribonuclease III [Patescibacteria group bacterium]
MEIEKLEKKLNLEFKNKDLIKQAFIHRSYINENPGLKLNHNERLEFLGDAVLELIITEHLFNNYPNPEGELTCWRAALVNSRMLSEISNKLGFNDYLLLSKGEQAEQGRARQFILANIIEAVIGAIYLDQGYDKVKEFIDNN